MNHFSPILLNSRGRYAAVALVSVAAAGCGAAQTGARSQTAAEHASYIEDNRCAGVNQGQPVGTILGGDTVMGVRPLYGTTAPANIGVQEVLRGAVVTVAAEPGMTAEWLDRALECHSAAATLGQVADTGEPFFLPHAVVDITVQPAKDGFAIDVSTNSPHDAQRILDRALSWSPPKAPPSVSMQ